MYIRTYVAGGVTGSVGRTGEVRRRGQTISN